MLISGLPGLSVSSSGDEGTKVSTFGDRLNGLFSFVLYDSFYAFSAVHQESRYMQTIIKKHFLKFSSFLPPFSLSLLLLFLCLSPFSAFSSSSSFPFLLEYEV